VVIILVLAEIIEVQDKQALASVFNTIVKEAPSKGAFAERTCSGCKP
jgi:hypothetical protein